MLWGLARGVCFICKKITKTFLCKNVHIWNLSKTVRSKWYPPLGQGNDNCNLKQLILNHNHVITVLRFAQQFILQIDTISWRKDLNFVVFSDCDQHTSIILLDGSFQILPKALDILVLNYMNKITDIQGISWELRKSIYFVLEPNGIPGSNMGGHIFSKYIHFDNRFW